MYVSCVQLRRWNTLREVMGSFAVVVVWVGQEEGTLH